jgi:peptidoglycan-N-acetylglucosamine deacetylase
VAADHPEVVTRVRDAGAAIATGGWDVAGTAQDSPAGAAAVVTPADLDRTITALGALGIVPDGFRLPGGEWPDGLADLLLERGITWSSSFVAGERPFRLPGATGELVELPFHWTMDDRQSFVWNFAPATPRGHARIAGYDEVLDNWRAELRATHAEGGLWMLSLHPEIIGTPGRVALLDEILAEVAATSGCRVVTGPELAGWWAEHGAPDPAAHPMRRFLAASGRTHL